MSNLPSLFSQVKFGLTAPQAGAMFECKSKAEIPMMALHNYYDKTELLANGDSLIILNYNHPSNKAFAPGEQ